MFAPFLTGETFIVQGRLRRIDQRFKRCWHALKSAPSLDRPEPECPQGKSHAAEFADEPVGSATGSLSPMALRGRAVSPFLRHFAIFERVSATLSYRGHSDSALAETAESGNFAARLSGAERKTSDCGQRPSDLCTDPGDLPEIKVLKQDTL